MLCVGITHFNGMMLLIFIHRIIEVMNQVLYRDFGFTDNTDDYYDVDNSFIDQVLRRRKGIPITLSVLYIVVASRLGLILQVKGCDLFLRTLSSCHVPPKGYSGVQL